MLPFHDQTTNALYLLHLDLLLLCICNVLQQQPSAAVTPYPALHLLFVQYLLMYGIKPASSSTRSVITVCLNTR